jgi:hypothetical protein
LIALTSRAKGASAAELDEALKYARRGSYSSTLKRLARTLNKKFASEKGDQGMRYWLK